MDSNHPSLAVYLTRAAFWFDDALQSNLKRKGLLSTSRTHALVMGNLGLGEFRPSRLAKAVGMSAQAISHVLSDMVGMGLIEMQVDPADARARIVRLTPYGLEYQAEVRSTLARLEARLEARFSRQVVDLVRMVVESDWGEPPDLTSEGQ